jgi:hypothetical protein
VPNLESIVSFGRGLFDHHLCHLGRWRATMQLFDELPDGRFVTLQEGLDASVGGVADPTGYAKLIRLFLRPSPEENSLNAAGD